MTTPTLQRALDFIETDGTVFANNRFNRPDDFRRFIQTLVTSGVDPSRLHVEIEGEYADVLWVRDTTPATGFPTAALVAVASSKPDECDHVEGQGVRLWWD